MLIKVVISMQNIIGYISVHPTYHSVARFMNIFLLRKVDDGF